MADIFLTNIVIINDSNHYSDDQTDYYVEGSTLPQSPIIVEVVNPNSKNGQLSLCGVPGICSNKAAENCYNVTLNNCEDCPSANLAVFISLVGILGATILLGNFLVLHVCYQFWRKRTLWKIDKFRISLAMADILAGNEIIKFNVLALVGI